MFGLKDNNCPLAQLVEQMTVNHLVRGSSPRGAAILTIYKRRKMSIIKKLQSLNLSADTEVSLSYSDGADVFVHNETEVEDALSETDVVSTFAELIATRGLRVSTQFGGNVLERLREDELLDDYKRDGDFATFLADVISETFYEYDFIESSIEKYDYKRGFCTLSANVKVPLSDIIEHSPFLSGWEVSVKTDNGNLTLKA